MKQTRIIPFICLKKDQYVFVILYSLCYLYILYLCIYVYVYIYVCIFYKLCMYIDIWCIYFWNRYSCVICFCIFTSLVEILFSFLSVKSTLNVQYFHPFYMYSYKFQIRRNTHNIFRPIVL